MRLRGGDLEIDLDLLAFIFLLSVSTFFTGLDVFLDFRAGALLSLLLLLLEEDEEDDPEEEEEEEDDDEELLLLSLSLELLELDPLELEPEELELLLEEESLSLSLSEELLLEDDSPFFRAFIFSACNICSCIC